MIDRYRLNTEILFLTKSAIVFTYRPVYRRILVKKPSFKEGHDSQWYPRNPNLSRRFKKFKKIQLGSVVGPYLRLELSVLSFI